MNKQQLLLACGIGVRVMSLPYLVKAKPAPKPNILFVFADQFRTMEKILATL